MIEYTGITALVRESDGTMARITLLHDGARPCDGTGCPLEPTTEVTTLRRWGTLDGERRVWVNSGGREVVW